VVVKKSFWADRSIKLRKINFLLVASRCHQELMISEMKKTLTIRISAKKNMFWYFKWILQLLSNPIECTHFYQRFFRASKQFIKKQKKAKNKNFSFKIYFLYLFASLSRRLTLIFDCLCYFSSLQRKGERCPPFFIYLR
jgi:hypothetical protein